MSLYCWNFSNSAFTSTCLMCITSSTVRDRHSTGKQNSSCNNTEQWLKVSLISSLSSLSHVNMFYLNRPQPTTTNH
ncbi:hypothetical protein EYF80_016852 [Liparis tanakae]|uniref:Uncharacterized protein n=1 Tax=Liparis tanakae TaxID=230148 RepID=A0A4Z2I6X4_9TELE|nr:hypothetical protein EYF80_016852 [Liparis tanakae]